MPGLQQKRSWVSTLVFGLFALLFSADGVHAQQKFPAKPIRLIVPVAPGDPLDIQARRMVPKLTESFGQSVVVDNRPGDNYLIGTKIAVSATPDGYTVILVASSYIEAPARHCGDCRQAFQRPA